MSETRVLVLLGSLRAESLNRQVAERLRAIAPADVTLTIAEGLAELPFYNEDLDGSTPPAAAADLRAAVADADRLLIVTPEYNGSLPAVIKNAIDWLSRPYGQGAISGKPVGVVGVAPTPYGAKWAHEHAVHSVGIAGGRAVAEAVVSQSALGIDVAADADLGERLAAALTALVESAPVESAA